MRSAPDGRRVAMHHPAGHPHAAGHPPPGPSFDGSVVADIGAHVGALVVYACAAFDGREIEIASDDSQRPPTHVAVRERQLPDGSTWAAFFPALAAGEYRLYFVGDNTSRPVTIAGGAVMELEW